MSPTGSDGEFQTYDYIDGLGLYSLSLKTKDVNMKKKLIEREVVGNGCMGETRKEDME